MRAKTLTQEQIEKAYLHFEHGGPAPFGITMKSSFTKTMGRYYNGDPHRVRPA